MRGSFVFYFGPKMTPKNSAFLYSQPFHSAIPTLRAPPLPPPPPSSKICDSPVQTETAHQYCGNGALSTGFVAGGEEGCRGLCTATPLCRFFSSWEGGWQRHADANEQPPPPLSHFPTSPPLLSLALTLARAHQVCAHVELRCAAECQKRS